ncbi:MAG: hypothetical protein QOJ19_1991 [Acidimicrobiia bacterium]|nr:hypothetical protein [Acidimicrobiia bacterium]
MVACGRAEACAAEFDLLKEPAEADGYSSGDAAAHPRHVTTRAALIEWRQPFASQPWRC